MHYTPHTLALIHKSVFVLWSHYRSVSKMQAAKEKSDIRINYFKSAELCFAGPGVGRLVTWLSCVAGTFARSLVRSLGRRSKLARNESIGRTSAIARRTGGSLVLLAAFVRDARTLRPLHTRARVYDSSAAV